MDEMQLIKRQPVEGKIGRFEKYREQYEGGMLTQPDIVELTNSNPQTLSVHIKKYKWNVALAIQNYNTRQKKKKEDIVRQHKHLYTEQGYSIAKLAKFLKFGANIVRKVARTDNWIMQNHQKGKYMKKISRISKIKKNVQFFTVKDFVQKSCKKNICQNKEDVLRIDNHSIQVKIYNRTVQVERKPYLLETYTEEYIKYVETQKM